MFTLLYAGALALLGTYLAIRSTMTRGSTNTLLGTRDSFEMLQITRAHGQSLKHI